MQRTILTPPVLGPAALGELKDWLGIAPASTAEDPGLTALLRAALDACEAFTGSVPLLCACEVLLDPGPDWQRLAARPVQAITAVQAVPASGPRTDLPAAAYAVELTAAGGARVRVAAAGAAPRAAVRFSAGLAADWAALPDGLRHGLVRHAAQAYRQRDQPGEGGIPPAVPAPAVAALWRPWRRVRVL